MPVPIPGLKVWSDKQQVKFLTIFGRPKTGIFRGFRGVPSGPNSVDMDTLVARRRCEDSSKVTRSTCPSSKAAGRLEALAAATVSYSI